MNSKLFTLGPAEELMFLWPTKRTWHKPLESRGLRLVLPLPAVRLRSKEK